MYQHNNMTPDRPRADCLTPAVRWTPRNPPHERMELPPALVRNRPAARRPGPRDAAAHRGPDTTLLAAGDGGVPARGDHAGHHLVHPPGDQDDHRRRADQAGPRGPGPRDRPAD